MRILIIAACPFPCPRGTPVRIHRIGEALVNKGHEIEVATYHLYDPSVSLPFKVSRIANIGYYTKTSPGPSWTKLALLDPLLTRLVWQRCREQRFDLIHAHHIEGLLIARAVRRAGVNLPVIYDAHTQIGKELTAYGPSLINGVKRQIGAWLDTRLPARADHIIAVTDELRDVFVANRCKPPEQVTTVINGVEHEFVEKACRARADHRTTGALAEPVNTSRDNAAEPNIVFAGNLAAYQGIDLLLQAFALVRHVVPQAKLTLLTDSDFSPFAEQAKALGVAAALCVRPISLDALPAALVQAQVLVNPRTECSGMPQKLLNYMASGTPIVSFQGSARLVEHRRSALIIDNGNSQGFANAILDLLKSAELSASLGRNAQALIRKCYSWQASAEKVEQVYAQLTAGHR